MGIVEKSLQVTILKISFSMTESEKTAVGIRHADHVAPLYPQKLALTSPTSGSRSVGIVRSRTQTTEFVYLFVCCYDWI
jgi:hypothetical protein